MPNRPHWFLIYSIYLFSMSFVLLRTYDTYIPASLMMQRLEAEGIKTYLQDEHTLTMGPMFAIALGGIKLMVYKDQLDRATALVSQYEAEYLQAGTCPKCGSHNIQFITESRNLSNWLFAILSWAFTNYAVGVKQVYHCYQCHHEFEKLPDGNAG
jgi:hypothetical protein